MCRDGHRPYVNGAAARKSSGEETDRDRKSRVVISENILSAFRRLTWQKYIKSSFPQNYFKEISDNSTLHFVFFQFTAEHKSGTGESKHKKPWPCLCGHSQGLQPSFLAALRSLSETLHFFIEIRLGCLFWRYGQTARTD